MLVNGLFGGRWTENWLRSLPGISWLMPFWSDLS